MAFQSRVHSEASSRAVKGKLVERITHHFAKFSKYICHGQLVLLWSFSIVGQVLWIFFYPKTSLLLVEISNCWN